MKVTFLRPVDQFSGVDRLLQRLKLNLANDNYSHFRIAVAFAKVGPLLRLNEEFKRWREKGKTIEAIFGIDLRGTSKQALEFALRNFDATYITHTTANAVFHLKFYLFEGSNRSLCLCGSHNLTVGGTETNLEGGAQIEFELPEDQEGFQEANTFWQSLLPPSCAMTIQLNERVLESLLRSQLIHDESSPEPRPTLLETVETKSEPSSPLFPRAVPKPPTPIPHSAFVSAIRRPRPARARPSRAPYAVAAVPPAQALVIQIIPHHNGEVFLSKLAVNENPGFFGFPFTGQTAPKKPANPAYPQRIPDPAVNISVYGAGRAALVSKEHFGLNMVYYERKSEIRITFSPDLTGKITHFAVMVMRKAGPDVDYEIEVHNPYSPHYKQLLAACNRKLPSGGATKNRKYGWL